MTLKIIAFGIAKDILGTSQKNTEIKENITVEQFKKYLLLKYPEFSKLSNFMIAINTNYAKDKDTIKKGDEVAIIPPTSGG